MGTVITFSNLFVDVDFAVVTILFLYIIKEC